MKTVDLSKFNNDEYTPGNPVKRGLWYVVSSVVFKSYLFPFYGLKRSILKWFGATVGKNVVIKPSVNIKYPWFLVIGDNTWIGEGVWIDNLSQVTIGKNCCLSQGALLLCGNHDYKQVSFDLIAKPITLEDGCWIGARATVSGGVRCNTHAVLSINSATSADLEAYTIYRGNPAVAVKERVLS